MGPPKDNRKYNIYEYDGIKIYMDIDMRAKKDVLKIRLTRFLWKKEIKVDGLVLMK